MPQRQQKQLKTIELTFFIKMQKYKNSPFQQILFV